MSTKDNTISFWQEVIYSRAGGSISYSISQALHVLSVSLNYLCSSRACGLSTNIHFIFGYSFHACGLFYEYPPQTKPTIGHYSKDVSLDWTSYRIYAFYGY